MKQAKPIRFTLYTKAGGEMIFEASSGIRCIPCQAELLRYFAALAEGKQHPEPDFRECPHGLQPEGKKSWEMDDE